MCYNEVMSNDIIVALIGFAGIVVGAIIGYFTSVKKNAVIEAKREQEQSDNFKEIFKRFDYVNKRLDEHNHYAEKFSDIAKSMAVMQKDIEYLKKGI